MIKITVKRIVVQKEKINIIIIIIIEVDPGFPRVRGTNSQSGCVNQLFSTFLAENCMKMKEFGPEEGCAFPAPPLGSANGHCYPGSAPLREFYRINTFKHWEMEGGARDTRLSPIRFLLSFSSSCMERIGPILAFHALIF